MKKKIKPRGLPPGIMGAPTAFLGRYREFDACFAQAELPEGSKRLHQLGCDVGYAFNVLAEQVVSNPKMQWLWILGDDHDFPPDLWRRLYDRNLDIVVPLCLRTNDHAPVFNAGLEGGFGLAENRWDILMGKSGLFEWKGTIGNAGMLIRRKVFEKMPGPWFKQGQLDPKFSSSDLYFSWEAQKYGFKIMVDLDNVIGHITHTSVRPERDADGNWHVGIYHAGVWG